jgi:CBS domain-containing protein
MTNQLNLKDILLKDVMVKKPITIDIDASFGLVEDYFRRYHIRHLPVVDKPNVLQGIITQRDLYKICAPRKTIEGELVYDKEELNKFILKYVMTPTPYALGPDDTLEHCIDAMVTTRYGCIPVVDKDKKLLGIVTQIDTLRTIVSHYIKR